MVWYKKIYHTIKKKKNKVEQKLSYDFYMFKKLFTSNYIPVYLYIFFNKYSERQRYSNYIF